MKNFAEVIEFHGHACPGLALGYRVSICALKNLGKRATDEEIVGIVENNSCAVDAVQVITGCTFGKGNLIFRDYGKQVYTFIKRPSGRGIRISVKWNPPPETSFQKKMWERYIAGDRSESVLKTVNERKSKKINSILNEKDEVLFDIKKIRIPVPDEAVIYPSIRCSLCNEKMMESRARVKNGRIVCIPCFEGE